MADLTQARRAPALVPSAVVRMLPPAARLVLRGGPRVMQVAGEALDLQITTAACSSARHGERAALWMGPDELLLLGPGSEAAGLARLLEGALAGIPHSIVDVSHRQVALEVAGPRAPIVLAVGCPLDLHPSQFPPGMCTRTVLGKASIVLWRTAAEAFHVEVWRSFADYASRFLAEAARELAC
ncbi:MAG TPA: sarcosine oxidase subunit gamma family protein [Steroidobacteraceae bacterium]|nr:sarcosine oxidase subunit gamma family protein [Steroidobacteraceae bacterium]